MDVAEMILNAKKAEEERKLAAEVELVEAAAMAAIDQIVNGQPAPAAPQAQPSQNGNPPVNTPPADAGSDHQTAPQPATQSPVMVGLMAAAVAEIQRHSFGSDAWLDAANGRAAKLAEYSGRPVEELKHELGNAAQPQQGQTTQQQPPADRQGSKVPGWLIRFFQADKTT